MEGFAVSAWAERPRPTSPCRRSEGPGLRRRGRRRENALLETAAPLGLRQVERAAAHGLPRRVRRQLTPLQVERGQPPQLAALERHADRAVEYACRTREVAGTGI